MAFSVAKQAVASKAVVAGRSRRATVRVQATVPENVAEARAWIDNWKSKQGGDAGLTLRDPKMPHWFPGTPVPAYLDGTTLVGDFGFDPLRLGADPAKLKWYVQAEVFHGRTAMLGVAGVLFPELLKGAGLGGPAAQVAWFEAGKFEYFAPPQALFISMMFMFAWVELRRWQDILKPGSVNQDPIFTNNKLPDGNEPGYPGGIFDPLGFAKGGNVRELRLKEIKNGRLAMLAFMGFWATSVTTGKTPLAALSQHLSDPWTNTVFDVEHARLLAQ